MIINLFNNINNKWKKIICPVCKGQKQIADKNSYTTTPYNYELTEGSVKLKSCPVCQGYGKIKIFNEH